MKDKEAKTLARKRRLIDFTASRMYRREMRRAAACLSKGVSVCVIPTKKVKKKKSGWTHGAIRPPKPTCIREGCDGDAVFDGGLCVNHRVRVQYKKCSHEGCPFYAKNANFCGAHMEKM